MLPASWEYSTGYSANGSEACKCETEKCETSGCNSGETKSWQDYLSQGCKLIPVAERCSECLQNGCSFCDRRGTTKAKNGVDPRQKVSFCWNSDDEVQDPFYGSCLKKYNEDLLKVLSNKENEDDICAESVQAPIVFVVLYLFIFTLCPLIICGFIWYAICFGIPRKIREAFCNTSSASVFAAPPNTNDFAHYGNWQGRAGARPGQGGRMYVIPNDTVQAEVSLATSPGVAVQTGVLLYGQTQVEDVEGRPSIVRGEIQLSASAGGANKEIPVAYAQEL
jgi:hypothetical protein